MNRIFQNKMLRCATAAIVATGILVAGPIAHADAQTPDDKAALSVSPPTVELDGNPGQTIKQQVSLDNISGTARSIQVTTQNFEAGDEQGRAVLSDDDGPNSLSSWIKVTPNKVTIPANGSQKFDVTISVPSNASPGGHFGALVFEPSVEGGDANVKVISRVTSLILLRLPGNATEKASIASIDLSPQGATPKDDRYSNTSFFQKGPVDLHVRVKNEGNVQVKPQTTIEIRNVFGSKVATLTPDSRNVLPGSIRRFDTTWNNKSLFGRYTVKVTTKYGTSGQTVVSTTSFWAVPLGKVGIGLGVFVVLFLIVWLPRKRWRKAIKALGSGE